MLAAHRDVRELVEIGAYVGGADPDADRAMARMDRDRGVPPPADGPRPTPLAHTWARLHELVAES